MLVQRSIVQIGGQIVEGAPKTKRSKRVVSLDEMTTAALRAHRAGRRRSGWRAGAAWSRSTARLPTRSSPRLTLERRVAPTLPAPVLAQAWRGGPQRSLTWLLSGCRIEPMDERTARAAGALCGAAGTSDVVDAVVVSGAVARADTVASSDRSDLERLTQALDAPLVIHDV
jgi:hypothetical protein